MHAYRLEDREDYIWARVTGIALGLERPNNSGMRILLAACEHCNWVVEQTFSAHLLELGSKEQTMNHMYRGVFHGVFIKVSDVGCPHWGIMRHLWKDPKLRGDVLACDSESRVSGEGMGLLLVDRSGMKLVVINRPAARIELPVAPGWNRSIREGGTTIPKVTRKSFSLCDFQMGVHDLKPYGAIYQED